jgi:hypothetical protein
MSNRDLYWCFCGVYLALCIIVITRKPTNRSAGSDWQRGYDAAIRGLETRRRYEEEREDAEDELAEKIAQRLSHAA